MFLNVEVNVEVKVEGNVLLENKYKLKIIKKTPKEIQKFL